MKLPTIRHTLFKLSATAVSYIAVIKGSSAQPISGQPDVGSTFDAITRNVSEMPTLFVSAAYIMGIGSTVAGLFKLRNYVDDPSRNFLKDAIVRLLIGGALIALPWVIAVVQNSMGYDDSASFGDINPTLFQ